MSVPPFSSPGRKTEFFDYSPPMPKSGRVSRLQFDPSHSDLSHHSDRDTGRQYWFVNPNNKYGELLPEWYRTYFSKRQIVCLEYQELQDTVEREIISVPNATQNAADSVTEELQEIELQALSTPREGDVEDGAEWTLPKNGSDERPKSQHACTRAQEESCDEGEGEQLENCSPDVPTPFALPSLLEASSPSPLTALPAAAPPMLPMLTSDFGATRNATPHVGTDEIIRARNSADAAFPGPLSRHTPALSRGDRRGPGSSVNHEGC
ncbi:hypothetical protein L218DRAFT_1004792 [Marasmius fiardii PR-910]|nr:hypothetical protein L218DRAFT_1004792 [Marasmius fiardii PR-910]